VGLTSVNGRRSEHTGRSRTVEEIRLAGCSSKIVPPIVP